MFVYSFRASSVKAFAAIGTALLILATLILTIPSYGALDASVEPEVEISYSDVKNAEDAARFLSQFGWEVSPKPIKVSEITVPSEFGSIFVRYNEIQKRQGLDLEKYKLKTLTRYTFEITNYKDASGKVFADVLTYRNTVVAGDISHSGENGFVYGFSGK
ncbi:MAG: DUF4830 domain-containing protein [Clostridia bacterium]|nr:DUF4830 domain-containing protein [Clostridia bacterium]